MKKILSLTLSFLLVFGIFLYFDETYYAQSSMEIPDTGYILDIYADGSDGFYILSNNENLVVTHIFDDLSYTQDVLSINADGSLYAYDDGCFYFLKNISVDNGTSLSHEVTITRFDCIEGTSSLTTIKGINSTAVTTFSVCQGYYYIPCDYSIKIYSKDLKEKGEINLYSKPQWITSDGEYVYCSTIDNVFVINGQEIFSSRLNGQRLYPHDNGFSTENGTMYKFDGNNLCQILNIGTESRGIGKLSDSLIYERDGYICAGQDNEIKLFPAQADTYICSSKNTCGCFYENNNSIFGQIIRYEDIQNFKTEQNDNNISTPSQEEYYYRSETYHFDDTKHIITGIQPSSTIAQIKNNIQYSNYTLSFLDHNGNTKNSGSIGTNAVLKFDGKATHTYTVIIFGDLTGEGNINSSDKKQLVSHLLGIEQLSDSYLSAADITDDNSVNLKDLVALSQYLSDSYEINQKR